MSYIESFNVCTALGYLKIGHLCRGYGSQHIAMSPVQVKVSNFSQPISGLELTVDDFLADWRC